MILDILGIIIAAFLLIGILDLIVGLAIAYVIYRFLSGLNPAERGILIGFLVLIGLTLIVTLIGAEIGVISILAAVFATIMSVVVPIEESE